MKIRGVALGVLSLTIVGCGAKGAPPTPTIKPHVAVYPGAEIISDGAKIGVDAANLAVHAPQKDVIAFYLKELALPPDSAKDGVVKGTKDGHEINIIVSDVGNGNTVFLITENP